jgi:hypothetical protein
MKSVFAGDATTFATPLFFVPFKLAIAAFDSNGIR